MSCWLSPNNIPDDARISKAADNLLSSFHQKKDAIPAAEQAQLLKLAPGIGRRRGASVGKRRLALQ